jgi:hypothetical protein
MSRTSVSSERFAFMGLNGCPNGPTLPPARTHPSARKKSPLSLSSQIATASTTILEPTLESSLRRAPRRPCCHAPHRHGCNVAVCCTAPKRHPPAFISPHRHSPLAVEFSARYAAWSMGTTHAHRSSLRLAARLPPSSLSMVPERHLLAITVPHQVGRAHR